MRIILDSLFKGSKGTVRGMSKPVKFTVSLVAGRYAINIPAAYSETGKRQRLFFPTKARALAEQDRRLKAARRFGSSVAMIPADDLADAQRALAILKPLGASLSEAAREFVSSRDIQGASVSVSALRDQFVAELKANGRQNHYIRTVRTMATRLAESLQDRLACDVTREDARAFVAPMTGATQRATKRHLSPMFSYAMDRGWAVRNPFEKLRTNDAARIEIMALTASECEALHQAASEAIRPYIILATWCGIRPAELKRLQWGDVKFDKGHVDIRADVSKTKRRRFVDLAPNVRSLLEPYRGRRGAVVGVSEKHLATLQKKAREAAELERWQRNVLRHTFASHFLTANGDDMNALARQLGHTSTETAHAHYLDAVELVDARKFWEIGLSRSTEPVGGIVDDD